MSKKVIIIIVQMECLMSFDMVWFNVIRNRKLLFFFDRNRIIIYDSRVGFLDLKAHSFKDELERDEINKLIDYMKPLMKNATDRKTINIINCQFKFNKLLTSRGTKIQNVVLTKEVFKANALKVVSCIKENLGTFFMIYNYMVLERVWMI